MKHHDGSSSGSDARSDETWQKTAKNERGKRGNAEDVTGGRKENRESICLLHLVSVAAQEPFLHFFLIFLPRSTSILLEGEEAPLLGLILALGWQCLRS